MVSFWRRVFGEGIIAGVIGYLIGCSFFAILNLLDGKSAFLTPAMLGSVLFYGVQDPLTVSVSAGPVISMNGVYILLYIGIGVILAALAAEAEEGPHMLFLSGLVIVVGAMALVGVAVMLARFFGPALPAWRTISSGMLAVIAMVVFLYWEHPAFRGEMREDAEMPEQVLNNAL